MPSLEEKLTDETKREKVIDGCVALIDDEVKDKSGFSGMAIKTGYKVVQGIKPGFVRNVVRDLLPEFARALDPLYQESVQKGAAPGDAMRSNPGRMADALLGITDAKAAKSNSGAVKGAYDKLRGMAKKNVEAAAPRLAKLVDDHAR